MKRIVKTAAAMLAAIMLAVSPCTAAAQTQNTTRTEQTAGTKTTKKAPKTEAELLRNATPTGETHTDDKIGKRYPVYAGAKGGKFYIRISSRTGNPYRAYIKKNKITKK